MTRLVLAAAVLVAASPARAASAVAAVPDTVAPQEERLGRALLGARTEEGDLVLHGAGGLAMILPHVTLAARLGLGAGFGGEIGYRNLAFFGQEGRLRIGWGARANAWLTVGVAARTSISTLSLADGNVVGIELSNVPLGNDWEIGEDVVATIDGPGGLFLTAAAGPTFTMGGLRPTGYQQNEFRIDPAIRGALASGIAEWGLWRRANVFLRFDALFLAGVETDDACVAAGQDDCGQLVPVGFLPSASIGIGWAP